jgi:hypothetical protein
VAAEVNRLRSGCTHAGNWNLQKTCWHLNRAYRFSMRPGPHDPVRPSFVQKMQIRTILAFGRIPSGIQAPERALPPNDAGDASIDEFLEAIQMLKDFKGDFAPHPKLGSVDRDTFYKLHLIHSAHHLGFLTPTKAQA